MRHASPPGDFNAAPGEAPPPDCSRGHGRPRPRSPPPRSTGKLLPPLLQNSKLLYFLLLPLEPFLAILGHRCSAKSKGPKDRVGRSKQQNEPDSTYVQYTMSAIYKHDFSPLFFTFSTHKSSWSDSTQQQSCFLFYLIEYFSTKWAFLFPTWCLCPPGCWLRRCSKERERKRAATWKGYRRSETETETTISAHRLLSLPHPFSFQQPDITFGGGIPLLIGHNLVSFGKTSRLSDSTCALIEQKRLST